MRGAALAWALVAVGCTDEPGTADPCRHRTAADDGDTPAIHTPRWAFEPWISKDISSTDDTYEFVEGFQSRDIPLGVVVLDSPWETHYNTFVPNPDRYHDFEKLVADLAEDDIRVVVWVTQMVNETGFDVELGGDTYDGPAPNYQHGLDCGFYVSDGVGWGWWKGVGAALDFFDPEAVGWWHRLQDPLFDMGIAGFKLDFGESYITTPTISTHTGEISHQEYSEAYYRDFFDYGGRRQGTDEFVTMVRPYDRSYSFDGRFFARPEHAPVAWVGDNRRDWVGLSDALDHIFRSADAGYVMLGSDIGGYLDRDDQDLGDNIPFDVLSFQRWTALGALTPFMQLHGRANLSPWTVEEDADRTVEIYRYWASLHHAMVPFFYSLAQEAYAGAEPIIRPQGALADWPGDYRFMLGEALLVAPILDATGIRDIVLPDGAYYDWWDPAADAIAGGQTLAAYDASAPEHIGLFVKRGAIIPLSDVMPATGLGAAQDMWLVYPSAGETQFVRHDEDGATTTLSASGSGASVEATLSRITTTTHLRIRTETAPTSVDDLTEVADRDELDAADEGWFYEAASRSIWVKLGPGGERTVTASF